MFSIFLMGVGLSMDALAVSVANAMTIKNFSWKHGAVMAAYFGAFQALMPALGCLLGSTVSGRISAWGPYISFVMLAFVGGKMIYEAVKGGEESCMLKLDHKKLVVLAVATSIDALAVGVTFAFMDGVSLVPACLLIGATTFAICFAGSLIGGKIKLSCNTASILGGCVLVLIGIKLLLEGIL